jgi:hypothetical protein
MYSRSNEAEPITEDGARRIAANIVKLRALLLERMRMVAPPHGRTPWHKPASNRPLNNAGDNFSLDHVHFHVHK